MAVLHLTKENFDETIQSGKTLVDFWASWCGPCRMVAPIIEELAVKYDGKAAIAKVNVDEEGELAMRYGVMSIPTVIVFENGEEIGKRIGASPIGEYEKMLG